MSSYAWSGVFFEKHSGSWVSDSHSSQFLVMGMYFLHIEGETAQVFQKI